MKKMEKINKEFNVPFYIFEEIVEYIEQMAQGRCRAMKWKNIKTLLRLAKINNRLTDKQIKYIIDTYCRE